MARPQRSLNYYQVLGLKPGVTAQEIKKAYRQLVKSHHPDIDYSVQSASERGKATERMAKINEAYETLIDKSRRAEYDVLIGFAKRQAIVLDSIDEERLREKYLRGAFTPARQAVVKVLGQYKKKLADLSQDIFDDQLVSDFEVYVNEVESGLLYASQSLSSGETPKSLVGAVRWMRHSIAQAADGLDELRRFCQNYDYQHLYVAQNLFKIAVEHSRRALHEVKAS